MEFFLALYIVYKCFELVYKAWNGLPQRFDDEGNPIHLDKDGREVYTDGSPVGGPTPQERAREAEAQRKAETKQTKSGKKYTVTEPDVDGCTVYNLDGGGLDDDDDLIYPE